MNRKQIKEEFISNLNGTSVTELTFMALFLPLGSLLDQCVRTYFEDTRNDSVNNSKNNKFNWKLFWFQFFGRILPLILMQTICSDTLSRILLFGFILLVSIGFLSLNSKKKNALNFKNNTKRIKTTTMNHKIKPFLTEFRSTIMISTCIAILAVDFPSFPRRFAKTESFGTSLMDLGVGCFVFSNALVSSAAREETSTNHFNRSLSLLSLLSSLFRHHWNQTWRSVFPLVVMGLIRLVLTKGVDYQEHISEYGVHWNFFFTLSIVAVLSSLFSFTTLLFHYFFNMNNHSKHHLHQNRQNLNNLNLNQKNHYIPPLPFFIAFLFLLLPYQVHLSLGGGTQRILTADRHRSWFAANREGVLSCFGYAAVHQIGVGVGRYLWRRDASLSQLWILLCGVDTGLWIMFIAATELVQDVSRRMANLSYVVYVSAHSVLMLALFLIRDIYNNNNSNNSNDSNNNIKNNNNHSINNFKSGDIISAINHNQLPLFLLANLMTGLVNLSIDTLSQSSLTSVLILSVYMLILSLVACYSYHWRLNLQPWRQWFS